jgi:hypothetical protein
VCHGAFKARQCYEYAARNLAAPLLCQDPARHSWLYFTSVKGKTVYLDLCVFAYKMALCFDASQCLTPSLRRTQQAMGGGGGRWAGGGCAARASGARGRGGARWPAQCPAAAQGRRVDRGRCPAPAQPHTSRPPAAAARRAQVRRALPLLGRHHGQGHQRHARRLLGHVHRARARQLQGGRRPAQAGGRAQRTRSAQRGAPERRQRRQRRQRSCRQSGWSSTCSSSPACATRPVQSAWPVQLCLCNSACATLPVQTAAQGLPFTHPDSPEMAALLERLLRQIPDPCYGTDEPEAEAAAAGEPLACPA